MLAMSALEEAGYDLGRLTVLGSSVGGPFAILHGALDPRVPRVVVVHPALSFPTVLKALDDARGRPLRGSLLRFLAWFFLDSFDPLHHARKISPRELVIVAAERDRYFAPEDSQALYDRAQEPKRLIWTDSGHVRSQPDELTTELVRLIEELLEPAPLPAPEERTRR
jgi:fermentation-respiration switch protein FrsA (DUF1100 family)